MKELSIKFIDIWITIILNTCTKLQFIRVLMANMQKVTSETAKIMNGDIT